MAQWVQLLVTKSDRLRPGPEKYTVEEGLMPAACPLVSHVHGSTRA